MFKSLETNWFYSLNSFCITVYTYCTSKHGHFVNLSPSVSLTAIWFTVFSQISQECREPSAAHISRIVTIWLFSFHTATASSRLIFQFVVSLCLSLTWTQVFGYHGDCNEPLAAAFTLWSWFSLHLLNISYIKTSGGFSKLTKLCWNFGQHLQNFFRNFQVFFFPHFWLSKCKKPLQWFLFLYIFCIIFFTYCFILSEVLVRRKASEQRGSFHSAVCSLRCPSVFLLSKHRRHKNTGGQRQSERETEEEGERASYVHKQIQVGALNHFSSDCLQTKCFCCAAEAQSKHSREGRVVCVQEGAFTKHKKKHMLRAQQYSSQLQKVYCKM